LDYFFGFARQLTARSNIYTPIVTNRFRMCKSCVTSTWRNRYRRLPSRSRRSALLANWFTGASGDFCGRLGLARTKRSGILLYAVVEFGASILVRNIFVTW